MRELGFPHVYNILGGFVGWKVSKLPLNKWSHWFKYYFKLWHSYKLNVN
jgi:hypothetical protein